MTSVTSALIKVFESSGFECELIETERKIRFASPSPVTPSAPV